MQHTEKGFKLEYKLENFGYKATVEAEYKYVIGSSRSHVHV
jgi:hypothetical protein